MSDIYSHYESAVISLLDRLGKDHPRYPDVLVYQQRLLENIAQTRRYGDTGDRRAERAQVIDLLNQAALGATGMSFTQIAEKAKQELEAPEQRTKKRRTRSKVPPSKTFWGKMPFWARCLVGCLAWALICIVLVWRWDALGCFYQQLPLETQNTVLGFLPVLGGGGVVSILVALLGSAVTIVKERLENNKTLLSILKAILVVWLLVIIPSITLLVYFLSISGKQDNKYIDPKCAALATTPTPMPSATIMPELASTSTPAPSISLAPTLTPVWSPTLISTTLPAQTSLPTPTGTPIPLSAALLFPNMRDFLQACRGQPFGTGEASLTAVSCSDPGRTGAVMLSWKVPVQGSYAGCTVSLPPNYTSTLGENTALVFWLHARGEENFLIGFTSPDNPGGWKTVVEPVVPGWHQEVIPLSRFTDQGADLAGLSELVISFEYELGDASRQGALCIDAIGFASP